MKYVDTSIRLDVTCVTVPQRIIAKKYEVKSRRINVSLTDNGQSFPLPKCSYSVCITRANGECNAFDCVTDFESGIISFIIPTWSMEFLGECYCDIAAFIDGERVLISESFVIVVHNSYFTKSQIEDTNPGWLEQVSKIASMNLSRGSGLSALCFGPDLQAPGDYALAQGYGELIREADSSSAGAYFDALVRAGVIEPGEAGTREVKSGIASGYCALSLLNAIVPGDYALGGGRGTYVNGRGATGLGYEIVIDAQDGTSIGQRNFIIDFRAGCAVGYGLVMNPDGNAHGDLTPSNGFLFGCYSEMHADSSLLAGIYGNICHENVYGMGRRIVSAGDRQLLLAFAPNAEADTLLAVGDGDDAGKNPHNFIHILQDRTTGFASSGYIDIPTLTIGPGNSILHKHVFGMGTGLVSAADDQTLFGRYPKVGTAHLLVVGNGSKNAPGNVLEIYKDGKRTYLNTSLGVGEASSLSFSGNIYQGCLIAGRGITATNNWQTIVGSYPKLPQYSLFVVGDGTKGSPSNAMYIASNENGKATLAQINCRINCDMKISAGGAPTEDNDVIRLLEFNALLERVKKLEASSSDNFTLTFANELENTEFTLSVDGGTAIAGANCVGNSFTGKEFTFTPNSNVEVGIWYITDSNNEEQLLVDHTWLINESATLTLTENATITRSWYH